MARNAVVIGLGEFGLHLALSLSKAGCEVIALDINENKTELVRDYVTQAIIGDVRQSQVLRNIIPEDIDVVVVCLGTIESSIIASLYLKEMGIKNVHIKAINDEHERIMTLMGFENIIFPEKHMAERIAQKIMSKNMLDYIPLTEDYSIAEIAPLTDMVSKTLKDLDFRRKYNMSVIAIKELVPPSMKFMPGPNFVIKLSDVLIVMGAKEDIEKYNKMKD